MPETIFGGALAGLQQAQEAQYREALRIAQQTMQQAELAQRDKEFSLRQEEVAENRRSRELYQQEALSERARQFDIRTEETRQQREAALRVKREEIDSDMQKYLAGLDAKAAQERHREYYKLIAEYEKLGGGEVDSRARAFAQIISADALPTRTPGTAPSPAPGGPITPVNLGVAPVAPGEMQYPGQKDVGPPGMALGPRPMPTEQQKALTERPGFGMLPGVASKIAYMDALREILKTRELKLIAETALTTAKTLTEDQRRALLLEKDRAEIAYKQAITNRIQVLLPLEVREKEARLAKTYEEITASQMNRSGAQQLTMSEIIRIRNQERLEDNQIGSYRSAQNKAKNELPYLQLAIQKKTNEKAELEKAWWRDEGAIQAIDKDIKALNDAMLGQSAVVEGFQNMIDQATQRKRHYQEMLQTSGARVPATQYGTPAREGELPPAPINTEGLPGFPPGSQPSAQPHWPDGRPWRGIPYATTPVVPRGQSSGRSAPPPTRQAPKTQPPGRQEAKKSAPPAKKPATRAAAPGFDVLNPAAGYRAGDLTLLPAKKPAAKAAGKKKSVREMTDEELFRQMMGR